MLFFTRYVFVHISVHEYRHNGSDIFVKYFQFFSEESDSYTSYLRSSSAMLLKNAESRLADYTSGRPVAFTAAQQHQQKPCQSLPYIAHQVHRHSMFKRLKGQCHKIFDLFFLHKTSSSGPICQISYTYIER